MLSGYYASNKFEKMRAFFRFKVAVVCTQWCSKNTKLQDQYHLFFQHQDHFFKTKTAFFKDHQFINPRPLTNVARNFDWERPKLENFCDVILVTFFGGVIVMTSPNWRHNYNLKFNFVIISFKNRYLAKSRNFRSPILKVKRRWRRKVPSAWRFLKICN